MSQTSFDSNLNTTTTNTTNNNNPSTTTTPPQQQQQQQQQRQYVPQVPQKIWDALEVAKKTQGKFIKLQPGRPGPAVTLQFNPLKISVEDAQYKGVKTGGKVMKFGVIDPEAPEVEKELTLNVNKVDEIKNYLMRQQYFLDIWKEGDDKNFTVHAAPGGTRT